METVITEVAQASDSARPEISALELIQKYDNVRRFSEEICRPLVTEDYVIQSMPDCSPAKWHLAHTSWFFETFILKPNLPAYKSPHPQYDFLFNSYYNSLGARHCRPKRGLISRPTVADTYAYRKHVDTEVRELLEEMSYAEREQIYPIMELGLNHEQQHQELMITDLKHMLSENPLQPTYSPKVYKPVVEAASLSWIPFDKMVREIGHTGSAFSFDNETPRHEEFVAAFEIANRPVTNREYLEFMDDGGYKRPEFWLSSGWGTVQAQGWEAPLYWMPILHDDWEVYTLHGTEPVNLDEPVTHVSYFEAEAYAHWAKTRLSTEAEWETASAGLPLLGNLAQTAGNQLHPSASAGTGLVQMYGDVWEWNRSQYMPYPGYHQAEGAMGEYNGKFMCNQFVLRGGSCATPATHIRPTYRNFFPPDARWQFSGIRLARDIR